MPSRQPPPISSLVLLATGLVLGPVIGSYFSRRLTVETTVAGILAGDVAVGQALHVPRSRLQLSAMKWAPELDVRDPTGERHHRYVLARDPGGERWLAVLLWRTTFLGSHTEDTELVTEIRGTLVRATEAERARLREGFGAELADPALVLDEMEFRPVSEWVVGLAIALAAATLWGAAGLVSWLRSGVARPASAAAASANAVATLPAGRRPEPERRRRCPACGVESPSASRACSSCRAPVEGEYYVAAGFPLEGFERFVPVMTRVLKVSEYQARQPLARTHTAIPYQHLDSFHAKGRAATAPARLAGRGIASLVTARALAAELKEKGVEAVVVGSDELVAGPFPRKAYGLSFDDEAITFSFGDGGERRVAWSRLSLLVFSASMPLRGTLTMARDVREAAPSDPSAYLIDLYERDQPEGIRIAENGFHRWEFLRNGGSDRPADRFGKLMELLESRAREADIQYVTGVYRGPGSEWRMNFYSRQAYLVASKLGWAQREGPPRLEGYEVLEKVGEGGMGAVYRARQKKLGRIVALKVIASHLGSLKNFVARFQAEARAVAALSHPNIVQVVDLAESAGRHFMVMEFVEGQSLLRRIREHGRLEEAAALRIGVQVACALEHASQRGIVHRDVKPDNIFVGEQGEAKLGDWGLAKDHEQDLGLTDTGTAVGTPYYMSPEQARGIKQLDVRADLYSLGATLFHAVTGVPPFRGNSPVDVITKHLQAPVPDPRELVPSLTAETAEALMRLLAKLPDERATDGAAGVRMLERALAAAERELVAT